MTPRNRNSLITACVIALAYAPFLHAQEWTRFRGPNGSGVSDAKTVPVKWTDADYKWKIDLLGIGHSSPVVWGHRLFVTSADAAAGKRSLLCIDTGYGSTLWTRDFGLKRFRTHKNNSLASGTPTVDADHVYVLWQSPTTSPLIAYDHEGNQKWEYDLRPYKHGQGPGTSPIVYQDLVIVSNDHKQDSFLLAVDRRNGTER